MATITQGPPTSIGPTNNAKKLRHKASKPIITWLSKKLGGSHAQRPTKTALSVANVNSNSTDPSATIRGRTLSLQIAPTTEPIARTVILNDDQDLPSPTAGRSMFSERNSLTADSMWTKRSPALEADEDASIRPLPPTSPPSPTPSRSSSSQISDLRTFRSVAVSTKPTTLMSIDSGNGLIAGTMAHIAQAPSQSSPSQSNSNNPRFSVPLVHPAVARAASRHRSNMQAPLHTHHHPRNNPNPISVPADNASTLTLASSAFALSARGNDWTDGISVSLDQYQADGDINSSHTGIEDDDGEVAASVRALRPRSSRRGSWESEESRWSARVGSGPNVVGSPSIVSGLTRPPSIGGQSAAPSLSVSKLKLGVGNSDQESHRTVGLDQPEEVDAENERMKDNAPSLTTPDPLSYSPGVEGSIRDQEAGSTNRASVRFSVASDEPVAASARVV